MRWRWLIDIFTDSWSMSTDSWSRALRLSADLWEDIDCVYLINIWYIYKYIWSFSSWTKCDLFLSFSACSYVSDLFFSEERLAKELKETKDHLEDTKSRLNQRIMVWNKMKRGLEINLIWAADSLDRPRDQSVSSGGEGSSEDFFLGGGVGGLGFQEGGEGIRRY